MPHPTRSRVGTDQRSGSGPRAGKVCFCERRSPWQPTEPAGFVDTEDSVHEADIDALAASGITGDCKRDPLQYCTSDPSRRSHMATFLARALGLVHREVGVRVTVWAVSQLLVVNVNRVGDTVAASAAPQGRARCGCTKQRATASAAPVNG